MLHFQGRRNARNYLAQREQWRLLSLFGMLALVLVLMRFAGREQSWAWLFPAQPADEAPTSSPEPVDSVLPEKSAEVPDAVHMPPAGTSVQVAPKRLLPGLPQTLYAQVVDDTVLRGGDEHEAFFQTLAVLAKTDEQDASLPQPLEVSFVQLHRQPKPYRGEWVRVRGVARGAFPVDIPNNEHGVAELHQIWLQPEGRPDDLLAVNVLQLPPGFPTGESIEARVAVDGVFFKRWAYRAHDAIRTTPLVLARTVVWTPAAATAQPSAPALSPLQLAVGVSAVVFVGLVAFVFLRGGRRRSASDFASLAPNYQKLAQLDAGGDVSRMLAELRARELADDAQAEHQTESNS